MIMFIFEAFSQFLVLAFVIGVFELITGKVFSAFFRGRL